MQEHCAVCLYGHFGTYLFSQISLYQSKVSFSYHDILSSQVFYMHHPLYKIFLQGRNGEIVYSLQATNANPEQGLLYFYVDPYTGTLSVTQPLTNDLDQPDSYVVRDLFH